MSGDGGRTGELGVGVHTAHGVGHAVGSGASSHVVGVQSTAGAAAGGHGEVLLALLDALLLIGTGYGVLEPGGVGGVAGDGHIHALVVHDGHALANIISAVAADIGPLRLRIPDLADDVSEGVAVMIKEGVDVSITGNSTNPTRFQHPVAGTYKKECVQMGKKYFSVASGGGTGRTLHPDNMAAGPASYGMTDTMGRMHGDAQFAGSSSVPAHVEMMGLIGMGNNPMVGASVAVAVAVSQAK